MDGWMDGWMGGWMDGCGTWWALVVPWVGHGGALVESIAFNRRVVGSTPALAAM